MMRPRSCAPSARQRGFSLIEVIAAILLLAVTFTALMKVAGSAISLTQNAADHSEAAMWARGKLDGAFVGESVTPGSSSGQFNAKYRWQLDVTPWDEAGTPQPNALLHLYQLDLDVFWGPPGHPRSAHFRTLRLSGSNVPGGSGLPRSGP
jgi:general secretion pathway protein I